MADELESRWSDFHLFAASLHVVKEDYFGKTYEVNFPYKSARVYSKIYNYIRGLILKIGKRKSMHN